MRITIPDALADAYTAYATAANCSLDEIVTRQLRKTASVAPHGREVILGQKTLEALEARLGGGPIEDAKQLEARFARLASIAFEGIDLKLMPNALEELARRATRQGTTVEALVAEIAQRIARDFFDVPAEVRTTPRLPERPGTPIPGLANAPAH